MSYAAHIREEDQTEQTLLEHLKGTAELAGKFAAQFGAYDWGYCEGMLHDIGKYSGEFQRKLRERSKKRVDHSTAGAQLCREKGGMYSFLSYCIAGHHAGLPDTGGSCDGADSGTWQGRMRKKIPDYGSYASEVQIPILTGPPFDPVGGENYDFFSSMLIRMLYSCLVDADFLDTEQFMQNGEALRDSGESIEVLYQRLKEYVKDWRNNKDIQTINGRRTEILESCFKNGKMEKGLFRLTVPTGGGKTIASLAFALTHARRHDMKRIIYVIPYTSIIEQNAAVFRQILGGKNVLESHCSVNYEDDDKEEYLSMRLAAENWDKPVVVTTNVNFFESLFSNKSAKCRKLHSIADSVIIFDEAQMLPNDYLKPCVAALEQLIRYYRCSAVLCTATQPALKDLFSENLQAVELCPRMEEQFLFFIRASLENLGEISADDLMGRLEQERQVLCIVNTKKRAQEIFEGLSGEGIYHLSTAMYPEHRKRILCKIRERLKENKRCVVISTSLVEAGVDLDFQTVYRQIAGADSVIQAKGRCNREGKRPWQECYTWIFQLAEREYVPGQRQQNAITESLLMGGWQLDELGTIQEYFERLYHIRGESLDKKGILASFRQNQFPFKSVAREFRLIENNMWTVFILAEDAAVKLYEEIRYKGMSKSRMRQAGLYCVNIYEETGRKMQAAGLLQAVDSRIEDFYVLLDIKEYNEKTGLNLSIEYGREVIM